MARDDKGRFLPGHQLGIGGRPKNAARAKVQDLCWSSVNKIATYLFEMTEHQLQVFIEQNKDKLTRAEVVFLNASKDVRVIESLLDRIIGKQLNIDGEVTYRDPIIERLYNLPPGGVEQEIQQLLEARDTIDAEYEPRDVTEEES